MGAAAKKGYPLRMLTFLVPWMVLDLPREVRDHMARDAGPAYVLLERLVRGRFARREALAFRYA